MRKHLVVLALSCIAFFLSLRTEARGRAEDVGKMIQTASGVLFDRTASRDQIEGALIRLLDAAVLTLPQSQHAVDAGSKLEAARVALKNGHMLTQEGYELLDQAYRALNAGKSFQFPKLSSIEEARAHIQNLLSAAVAGLQKGQGESTSRLLLECVIMTVTPIER